MKNEKSIIICATQRTGSSMVFDDLLNLLGHGRGDGELLYTTIIRDRAKQPWEDIWPDIRQTNTFSGVSINKVMFRYVAHLSGFMAGIPVERPRPILSFDPGRHGHFYDLFRDAVWVYVDRVDVFAQAVSMYLAEATDVWESLTATTFASQCPTNSIPYDLQILKEHLDNFRQERQGWHSFFKHYGIVVMQIRYEEAIADYPHYLAGVLDRVGVHLRPPYPERRMMKLGDARNRRFGTRLRNDVLAILDSKSLRES